MASRRVALIVLLAVVAGAMACSKPPKKLVKKPTPKVTLRTARGKRLFDDRDKTIKRFDMNQDGNPDFWKVYKRVRQRNGRTLLKLVRMELDINYDGKIDIYRFYDDNSEIVREEMDLDFDGKIDTAIVFEGGKVVRKELSLAFDEKVHVWKHFERGEISRVERITKRGGLTPDRFELYVYGKLEAIGADKDGDGRPDVWRKIAKAPDLEKLPPMKPMGEKSKPPATAPPANAGPKGTGKTSPHPPTAAPPTKGKKASGAPPAPERPAAPATNTKS